MNQTTNQRTNQDVTAMENNTTQPISFPTPTGSYAVGTTSLYFVDPEREEIYTEDPNDRRELTARVWYPSKAVPGAETAPYFSEALISALVAGAENPSQDLVNFIRSVPTNSVANAPVAEAESEYPVLIFSHGRTTYPEYSTFLAEELASQGYIIVGINHTYESAVNVFPDGRVVPGSSIFDEADREGGINSEFLQLLGQNVTIKAEDAQFVLDELEKIDAGNDPTGLFNGKLDLNRVGIYGVSTGGAAAAKALSIEPRFKAGINLDGSLYGDVANASLAQPFMTFISEGFAGIPSESAVSRELEERRQPLLNNVQNEGYSVTISGTTHPYFATDIPFLFTRLRDSGIDLEGVGGNLAVNIDAFFNGTGEGFEPIDPNRFTQIINDYTTAFFNQHLNNQESPLLADQSFPRPEAYPEVISQFFKGDNLTSDKDGDDVFSTSRGNHLLHGGRGDDVLKGRNGSDALHGGGGDDSLNGGRGNDYLFGQDDSDFLHAGRGDDSLQGDRGNDFLKGGNGDDSLIGGDGEDMIFGGKANDILSGGAGDDTLRDTQGNNILYGDAGDDWLHVGQGDDELYGDSGNDILIGRSGDDRLNGVTGDDLLQGGSGFDRFYLSSGQDIIHDFQDGRDRLELPTRIDLAPLNFNDLDIVQIGHNTAIQWQSQGVDSNLGSQMNVTILQGIQASQITVADFAQPV